MAKKSRKSIFEGDEFLAALEYAKMKLAANAAEYGTIGHDGDVSLFHNGMEFFTSGSDAGKITLEEIGETEWTIRVEMGEDLWRIFTVKGRKGFDMDFEKYF